MLVLRTGLLSFRRKYDRWIFPDSPTLRIEIFPSWDSWLMDMFDNRIPGITKVKCLSIFWASPAKEAPRSDLLPGISVEHRDRADHRSWGIRIGFDARRFERWDFIPRPLWCDIGGWFDTARCPVLSIIYSRTRISGSSMWTTRLQILRGSTKSVGDLCMQYGRRERSFLVSQYDPLFIKNILT